MSIFQENQALLEIYTTKPIVRLFKVKRDGSGADYVKTKAGIYGTCDEDVMKELDKYKNFPGCRLVFTPKSRSYKLEPVIFKGQSFTNQLEYIYKQDCLNLLFRNLPLDIEGQCDLTKQVIEYICLLYIERQEKYLDYYFELIQLDLSDFEEIGAMFKERKTAPKTLKVKGATLNKVIQQIVKTCKDGHSFNEEEIAAVKGALEKLEPLNLPAIKLVLLCHHLETLIETMDDFVQQNLNYFQLNDKCDPPRFAQHIRLFLDDQNEFCLASEVYGQLELEDNEGKPLGVELKALMDADSLATVAYDYVKEQWRQTVNPRFCGNPLIHTPIVRSRRHARPIPSIERGICMLASDAVLELLRSLLTETGIFQKMNKDDDTDWNIFVNLFFNSFTEVETKFEDMTAAAPYLVNCYKMGSVEKAIGEKLSAELGYIKLDDVAAPPINENGFILEDLEKEIGEWNLVALFPNIFKRARDQYAIIKSRKERERLTTTDMFETLENCLLLSVYEKLPENHYKWLESQGATLRAPFDGMTYEELQQGLSQGTRKPFSFADYGLFPK